MFSVVGVEDKGTVSCTLPLDVTSTGTASDSCDRVIVSDSVEDRSFDVVDGWLWVASSSVLPKNAVPVSAAPQVPVYEVVVSTSPFVIVRVGGDVSTRASVGGDVSGIGGSVDEELSAFVGGELISTASRRSDEGEYLTVSVSSFTLEGDELSFTVASVGGEDFTTSSTVLSAPVVLEVVISLGAVGGLVGEEVSFSRSTVEGEGELEKIIVFRGCVLALKIVECYI